MPESIRKHRKHEHEQKTNPAWIVRLAQTMHERMPAANKVQKQAHTRCKICKSITQIAQGSQGTKCTKASAIISQHSAWDLETSEVKGGLRSHLFIPFVLADCDGCMNIGACFLKARAAHTSFIFSALCSSHANNGRQLLRY